MRNYIIWYHREEENDSIELDDNDDNDKTSGGELCIDDMVALLKMLVLIMSIVNTILMAYICLRNLTLKLLNFTVY